MKCLIFGGGYIGDYESVDICKEAYVIAADSGLIHTEKLGIKPDLIVGDFDSYSGILNNDDAIIKLPTKKDDTDMMFAVKKSLEMGFSDIVLYGALGGRLDHTYANIQTLEYISEHGGYGKIVSDNNIVMLQTSDSVNYPKMVGWYFSVFSLSEESIVGIKGTVYTLDKHVLKRCFPLGVSNEITDDFAEITVYSGSIVVMYSKK